ncbi:peptidoglycan-binding protein [uncultured Pluralibacter sp.]|uniref:peptidoglycan-binding protein n=1 Tax=uncultured Pluralibacter sp. TaxID=1490864 RepID=UPI0026033C16|nr:peptidoglycan-binding protein [uncultured Pluralibacter sp.]
MAYHGPHVYRITGTIGACGINAADDVKTMQIMINGAGYRAATGRQVPVDGRCGPETTAAIQWYQRLLRMSPNGLVQPTDTHFIAAMAQASQVDRSRPRTGGPLVVSQGQVTFDAEGVDYLTAAVPFRQTRMPYFSRVLHFPGSYSGVTLGRGYDMKMRSPGQIFAALREAGIEEYKAALASRAAGLQGRQAAQFVAVYGPLLGEITHAQQIRLFELTYRDIVNYSRGVYQRKTRSVASPLAWHSIDPAIKEVFIDTLFQGNNTAGTLSRLIANGGSRRDVANYLKTDPGQNSDPRRTGIRLRRLQH